MVGSSTWTYAFSLNLEVSLMLPGADIVTKMRAVEDTYRDISHELRRTDWLQRPVARLTATVQ